MSDAIFIFFVLRFWGVAVEVTEGLILCMVEERPPKSEIKEVRGNCQMWCVKGIAKLAKEGITEERLAEKARGCYSLCRKILTTGCCGVEIRKGCINLSSCLAFRNPRIESINVFHKRSDHTSEAITKTPKSDYYYYYYTTTLHNDSYSIVIDS